MSEHPDTRPPVGPDPPRWGGAAVPAVAVAVVAAVVVARARAAGVPPPQVGGPLWLALRSLLQAVTVVALATGLVLLAGPRGRPGEADPVAPPRLERRRARPDRRRMLKALVLGLLLGLVFNLVAVLLPQPPPDRQAVEPPPPSEPRQPPESALAEKDQGSDFSDYLVPVALLVTLAVVGAGLLRDRRARTYGEDDPEDEDDPVRRAALAEAVRAAREAVRDEREHDPRAAVVACFAAMERALARHGEDTAPRLADTPSEVLSRAALPPGPARTLLTLFRRARFSTHPVTERDRADADGALAELLDALGPGARR